MFVVSDHGLVSFNRVNRSHPGRGDGWMGLPIGRARRWPWPCQHLPWPMALMRTEAASGLSCRSCRSRPQTDIVAAPKMIIASVLGTYATRVLRTGTESEVGQQRRFGDVRDMSALALNSGHKSASQQVTRSANRRHCHFRDLRKGISLLVPVPDGSHAAEGLE